MFIICGIITMANQQTEHLFQLIKSLTKAEKRNFKLYATRGSNKEDKKFIQLFDVLDKMHIYQEDYILQKIPEIKKVQLSNLKAHLYRQLLISLRFNHSHLNIDIQIREQIDYARILYNKGLYQQSLKILDKAKNLARMAHKSIIQLEIVEFEKMIEGQYITRSISNRAELLTQEADELTRIIENTQDLSSLILQLYDMYIKAGLVKDEEDYENVREFFFNQLPVEHFKELSFYEKLYLYIAYSWYSHIIQDFLMAYRYAQKWVNLFHSEPIMLEQEPEWYLKGIHRLSEALFNLQHYPKFVDTLVLMEDFEMTNAERGNENIELLTFLYLSTARINKYFMEGNFSQGKSLIPEILGKIELYQGKLDTYHVLVLHYKIASLYFGSGEFSQAITSLNHIINYKDTGLREDIHAFTRILNLIAHYEAGNHDIMDHQIRSVYHFLGKMNDLNPVHLEIFKFLRKLAKSPYFELKAEFLHLRDALLQLRNKPYVKRPFLYFDIISWLESKIENRSVQSVIHDKFVALCKQYPRRFKKR
ncbi:MAG: hypothetical protein NW226_00895 [Microscillaceae bacterium]|nr:hypothetical protein [Microscillaceae bacterium]